MYVCIACDRAAECLFWRVYLRSRLQPRQCAARSRPECRPASREACPVLKIWGSRKTRATPSNSCVF